MFLYRLRDNDEDIVTYEDFIITEESVGKLIKDSVEFFAYTCGSAYENIAEILESGDLDLSKYDSKLVKFLNSHLEDDITILGNATEFALEVLQENNIKVFKFEEINIWY